MARELLKPGGEVFKVVLALGEQDRRSALFERLDDVTQNQLIPFLISCQCCLELLYAREAITEVASESRLADDQLVSEWAPRSLASRINGKRTGPSCISVIGWCPSRRCGVAVRPTT